ncbi:hypothetical protein ACIQJX_35170 [Streptomyces griseoviridis]
MIRPEWADGIQRMVDGWPPVTEATYAQLALLLTPGPVAPTAAEPPPAQEHQAPQAA